MMGGDKNTYTMFSVYISKGQKTFTTSIVWHDGRTYSTNMMKSLLIIA